MDGNKKTIIIAGGGLIGPVCAIMFKKRGFTVKLFEKRPDIRIVKEKENYKSINIMGTAKGINALKRLDMWEGCVKPMGHPVNTRYIHLKNLPVITDKFAGEDPNCMFQLCRNDVNKALLERAEKEGVELVFEDEVVKVDFEKNKIFTAKSEEISYDYLIGADGVGSEVRKEMLKVVDSSEVKNSTKWEEVSWKELFVKNPKETPLGKGQHMVPRNLNAMLLFPNRLVDDFSGIMVFKNTLLEELGKDKEKIENFLKSEFAEIYNITPDLVDQFLTHPSVKLGTNDIWPWSYKNVCLVGDAAHSMTPFIGQGMNCGLDDIYKISQILEKTNDLCETFKQYAELQKPHGDAISRIASENFQDFSVRVLDPKFLLKRNIERQFIQLFPNHFSGKFEMVATTLMPYKAIEDRLIIQEGILDEIIKEEDALKIQFNLSFNLKHFLKYQTLVESKLEKTDFKYFDY